MRLSFIKELTTIKNKDLAFILTRVLSIYIFIQAIINLSQIINYSVISNLSTFRELGVELDISSLLFGSIAPSVILLVISIILWIFTNKISNYLLPDNTVIEDDCELNLNSVHTMIFSIIGVIIVSLTIPQIFYVIPDIIKMNELTLATQMKTDIIFSIVGVVVKILMGLALIVWSKKLTKLLIKLR